MRYENAIERQINEKLVLADIKCGRPMAVYEPPETREVHQDTV